jgi:serine/threonine protein kinase
MEYVENSCDLVTYIKQNTLSETDWKILLFQLLFVLQIIQRHLPEFRHNDLKPNNILIQKQNYPGYKLYQMVMQDGQIINYKIPRTGFLVKVCDYDFASVKGLVENDKVLAEWTKKYHITN